MTLTRGRVWRASNGGRVEPLAFSESPNPRGGVRVEGVVVEAEQRAASIVAAAKLTAASLLADAEQRAAGAVERSAADGRAEGLAEFLAHALRLRERENRAEEASLDRIVEVGRLLSERLLAHTLSISPGEIATLARQALDEARGARRIRIHSHPTDAVILSRVTAEIDPLGRVHAVIPDPNLLPGDLRLETDIGVVDARVGPSLAQLATRLREALRK